MTDYSNYLWHDTRRKDGFELFSQNKASIFVIIISLAILWVVVGGALT